MMNPRIAVIDLGTNTCNLLIAQNTGTSFEILYQGKEVVKLAKDRINGTELSPESVGRAVYALEKHRKKIAGFDVSQVEIVGTSAIRDATNRDWFCAEIARRTGLKINVISGEREADLIFKGVKLAFGTIEDHSLILDIGGGSNEFILTQCGNAVWKQSFPLGMARIIEQFPISNPITPAEIQEIASYFDGEMATLWERMNGVAINRLIGCAAAFDTIADLIDQTDPGTKARIGQEIERADFELIYRKLIRSTTEERTAMKGMESIRIEMIVPAVIFIKRVVDKLSIRKIYQTDFALREGVLFEKIFS